MEFNKLNIQETNKQENLNISPAKTDSNLLFQKENSEVQTAFQYLLEKSKLLKDEANKTLKTHKQAALEIYKKSLEALLKSLPKLVSQKENFVLEWRINTNENQKKEALQHIATIFSNCSHIYIEQKKYLMALYYARFSLWCDPMFFKANLRIVRALIDVLYLYEAQEHLDHIGTLEEAAKFQAEIATMKNEVAALIKKYSSSDIVVKFLRGKLDWDLQKAYLGPIELYATPDKGRGFRTRRDIAKGETLLIEKGVIHEKDDVNLYYKLLTELDQREDLKARYMELFPTSQYPIPESLLDSQKRYVKGGNLKNMFEIYCSVHPTDWKTLNKSEIDELLIKTQLNVFKIEQGTGIFPHMSFLNHSCDPNVMFYHANGMTLVVSLREIKQGEELYIPYAGIVSNRFERRSKLLSVYGFDCKCNRCERKGIWKEKENQLTGLKCPECDTEIACDDNKMFICPKGCWKEDYAYYEILNEETMRALDKLKDKYTDKAHKDIDNLNEKIYQQFALCHHKRIVALNHLGKSYANRKDEQGFKRCFKEMAKIASCYPIPEVRKALCNFILMIVIGLEREPVLEEELKVFTNFGLSLETLGNLWKEFVKGEDKNFLDAKIV